MDSGSGSMGRWEYIDFELEIREGNRRRYPVSVRSPAGEAQERMRLPFDEWELKDRLKDLEIALLRSGGSRRRVPTEEEQPVQEFGQSLLQALFVGEVRTRYEVCLLEARRQNKGLRLKLRVHPPELARLPWEFLYDPERDEYLSLSDKTPIVRYLDLQRPVEQLPVSPPLRILGMVASPHDLPELDVGHEKRLVEQALMALRANGLVELTWLGGQTWGDLQRAMWGGPFHIFHFIGHGAFDEASEEGCIALSDEAGRGRLLVARNLARLLDGHYPLRLAFLNSCEGAKGSARDAFSGAAATLVRRGLPAVVAMQYEVSDEAAIAFAHTFYDAVANGLPVDAAVAAGRTAVSMDSALEWGTPVLYMRSPDGRIFDGSAEDVPTEAQRSEPTQEETEDREEEGALRRYRERVEWAWADEELRTSDVQRLRDFANNRLGLSPSAAADIEREVMGDTIEAILERQTRDREEEERRKRLDELYAQARRSHQDRAWRAVIEVFDQIHTLDPAYPDRERLLQSSHEALAAWENTITPSNADRIQLVRTLEADGDVPVGSIAFSPDGRLFASAGWQDRPVRLWRVEDGALLHALEGHTDGVWRVAFSPDGKLLASGGDDVRLWRVKDGALLRTLDGVVTVAFSPDGRLLATSGDRRWGEDGPVRLWRVEDGTLLRDLEGHKDGAMSVAFSPDGMLLASGGIDDNTVRLWRVEDGTLLRDLEGHTDSISSVAFSPDTQLLASGSANEVRLWQVQTGTLLHTLDMDSLLSVAFSPDGRLLATSGEEVRLWRVEDGTLLRDLEKGGAMSVAFSPDGRLLASGGVDDNTVRLWGIA